MKMNEEKKIKKVVEPTPVREQILAEIGKQECASELELKSLKNTTVERYKAFREDIDDLKKDMAQLEKRLKNNIIVVEANADYINEFKTKLETTVSSVIEMVNNNKHAMDVIFRHLRWHQVAIISLPLVMWASKVIVQSVCNVWR